MGATTKDQDHYVAVPPSPLDLQVHRLREDDALPASPVHKKQTPAELYAQQIPLRERQENPLRTASLLSVLATHWMQPLISLGAQKILEQEDIWRVCPEDTCDALYARFVKEYKPEQRAWANLSPVAMALARTFKWDLVIICSNYLLYIGAMSMQPYLSMAILDYLNDLPNAFGIESGYVLVALLTIVSFLAVTCLNYAFFIASRTGANMRSVMMDMVYRKALRLSCSARQMYSTGEIVTLMSVDSERIFNVMISGPWLFVAPFAFVVSIVVIALFFDVVSALCGGVFLALVVYVSIPLAERIASVQQELLAVAEERVKVTSEALQGIRVMKFYAWEESLARRVERIREFEVKLYRKFHSLQIFSAVMLFMTPVVLGAIVLVVYLVYRGNLTVTEVFTMIAMVNISRLAVNLFPMAVAATSQVKIAYSRMDAYLTSEELIPRSTETINNTDVVPGSISVRNASFHWAHPSAPMDVVVVSAIAEADDSHAVIPASGFCLDGINVEIDAGSLVMVIGKVGSGKTSLLEAILGEMVPSSGVIDVKGDIAYVSQESWIRNSSVRGNILFESAIDSDRYRHVLEATQLAMDLYSLPNGDDTEIGDRGINLSGGQKARISIARAMYREHYDILILDDPLSAVDPHVAHAIFDKCIMGLAKEKTRVLVLNSHYDLLPHADKILVLQDGRIAGDGNYAEIVRMFPELLVQCNELAKLEKDVVDEHVMDEDVTSPATAVAEANSHHIAVLPKINHHENKCDDDPTRLVQDEDRVKGKVSGQTYMSYFNETGINGGTVVFVLGLGYTSSQSMRVLADWWQGHWASNMSRDGVDPSYSAVWFGMIYFVFIALCALLTIARGLMLVESCIRSSMNLHDDLFRRVLSAPINRYFDITPVGRILNRFSNDLDQMDSLLPQQYQSLLQSLAILLGCLVVCAATSVWVGLSYLPMMGIFIITGLYFKKTSREVKRLEGITRTPVFNLFGETVNGLHTIRAFNMQEKFMKLNKEAVDVNTSYYFGYWAAGRWLAIRLDWLSVLIILVVSFYLVATKGQINSVVAGISLTYSLMLTSMVQWVVRSADSTDNAMTSVERLLHFRSIPVEMDAENALSMNEAVWPSRGAIRFENLCLKYRPELPFVLRGVNMDINTGEKVGICGRTGAGKSSLMIALFRICEFESGTIFIDGTDIQNVKLRDLRRSLAIIPQDPVLYSGTLRENLDPFGDYSDLAIWSVLQQVHLAESVEKWGAGLDFVVAEQGDNLSVGQRQLLCIGRALLKDSKIAVLDEATANVDTATDNLIQVTIRETFQDKTVLIIAHRINTIMHCDKIAVMDAGQVAEFGSPTELLSRSESIFASLAKRSVQQ